MLFSPRLSERNPFPIATPTDPTEIGATILRQMNPDLDSKYHRFPVLANHSDSWKRSEKNYRGKLKAKFIFRNFVRSLINISFSRGI